MLLPDRLYRDSFENKTKCLKQTDRSTVICDSGTDPDNNKCKMEETPIIPGQGIDTTSVLRLKDSIVKPEISFSSVKYEISNGKNSYSSSEDSIHDKDELRKNNPLNLIKVDTLNEQREICSDDTKDINEVSNTTTSHVVTKSYTNKTTFKSTNSSFVDLQIFPRQLVINIRTV